MEFRDISRVSEAITAKRIKIDPCTATDCAVENDGSLVIGEFVDKRGV